MKAPQIIMIILICLSLGISLAKHGQPRPEESAKYNFWSELFESIVVILILYWGGFWG